jgi:hypothetical protein
MVRTGLAPLLDTVEELIEVDSTGILCVVRIFPRTAQSGRAGFVLQDLAL